MPGRKGMEGEMCMTEHALFLSPSSPVSLKSQYFPVLRVEQFLEQTLVSSLCLNVYKITLKITPHPCFLTYNSGSVPLAA